MSEILTIANETINVVLSESYLQKLPETALRFGIRVL